MKIYNKSQLTNEEIEKWLSPYSSFFTLEFVNDYPITHGTDGYPFINDCNGILVCNPMDFGIMGSVGGLAYPHGAVTVCVYPQEKVYWNGLTPYLYTNRFLHEILHHFDKPVHQFYDWLDYHPFLKIVVVFSGMEGFLGSKVVRKYYEELLQDVEEVKENRLFDGSEMNE